MPEFRLTQISDTHLARRLPSLTDNFHRVSEYIDARRPDLVINSGDMAFDAPMSNTLANVASKELNLMLQDIADHRELYIVDVDAIAADIGGGEHLPDGIHQSGLMQTLLRQEILSVLADLNPAAAPVAVQN